MLDTFWALASATARGVSSTGEAHGHDARFASEDNHKVVRSRPPGVPHVAGGSFALENRGSRALSILGTVTGSQYSDPGRQGTGGRRVHWRERGGPEPMRTVRSMNGLSLTRPRRTVLYSTPELD